MIERLGQLLIPAVTARLLLSFSLAEIGRFDEAIMIATEGVEIAQSPEHPVSLAMALWALGQSYLGKGGLSIAVPTLERALQLCRDQQLPLYLHAVTPATGAAYILDGRSSAAVELMESALRNDEKTKLRCWHSMTLVVLSEAVLTKGDARRATYLAERALDVARSHHQRGYEAKAQRLLGEIVSRQVPPDVDEASRHYSGALAVATECGMRPLIPHCHLGLGKLYGRTDKRDEALEHLATAVTMYREMDMGFWLEKAEAEVRQPG